MESSVDKGGGLPVSANDGLASELSPDVRARVLGKVRGIDSPTSRTVRLREAVVGCGAVLTALAVFAVIGGVRQGPRPTNLVIATSAGSAALAVTAAWMIARRRRTMFSPPRMVLLGLVGVLPAAFLAWKIAVTSGFANMSTMWPDRPGWRCFRYSLLIAAPLFAAFSYRWLRRDPTHPRLTGAALGVVAGACSTVFVDLWCPVAYVPHLLLGHVLPMLLLAVIGAAIGRRLLGLPSAASRVRGFPRA